MKVLLVDADSTIPNIALMKLSTYHKNLGDSVELLKLDLPYYPNKAKSSFYIYTKKYDKVYCSIVFTINKGFVLGENIEFGGTGYSITKKLPEYIEQLNCDYSIYDTDTSYGFITRGCIRNCPFCFVPEKEGYIHKVNTIDNIVKHKKVKFLDNNILAYDGHKNILKELVDKQIRCQFTQGLDIRLLDAENSFLLRDLNYIPEYTFAFDDIQYKNMIEKKLPLLDWRKPWEIKFFVYVNKDMPIEYTTERIMWCKENKVLPYLMRDINIWYTEHEKFYTDLASWVNQPGFFKKKTFEEYLQVRLKNEYRISNDIKLFSNSER